MPVKVFRRLRGAGSPAPKLTGTEEERISERPGALEEHFRKEAAFTAAADAARTEARRKAGLLPTKEAPMRVRMLQTRKGSADGIHARVYEAGQVVDLVPELAKPWLEKGICELDRMIGQAPQPGPPVGPAEGKPETPKVAKPVEPDERRRKNRPEAPASRKPR